MASSVACQAAELSFVFYSITSFPLTYKNFTPIPWEDILLLTSRQTAKLLQILHSICMYAPQKDEPGFFQNVFKKLSIFKCEYLVGGGDFNVVQNIEKD